MDEFQKILSSLLRGKSFKQPFIATDKDTYRDVLKEKLDIYVEKIDKLKTTGPLTSWLHSNSSNIKDTNTRLIKVLDEYLSGSAGKAYQEIEQLFKLKYIEKSLVALKEPMNKYQGQYPEIKSLFRVRENINSTPSRKDIFHIPFNKRNLVKNQRYSIAGVPCLYLGSSLYVCWQEMDQPDLNSLFLSHFKIDENAGDVNILNFAFSLETLKHKSLELFFSETVSLEKQKAYLAIWPILMACSFNIQHLGASFNVEYVIPNLLLQWIGKEKRPVSGIMYLSTKTQQLRNSDIGINFVFPPKTELDLNSEFCEGLSDTFIFSKPISWQLLDSFEYEENDIGRANTRMSLTDNIENQIIEKYKGTKFYLMELKLRGIAKLGKMEL